MPETAAWSVREGLMLSPTKASLKGDTKLHEELTNDHHKGQPEGGHKVTRGTDQ